MRSFLPKLSILLLSSILLNPAVVYAQQTAFDQLRSVNAAWKDHTDIDPALFCLPAKPLTEQQLLQFHLQQTEELLRKRNPNGLTALQKKNRETNLNTLHAYRIRGIFPVNDKHMGRQPYFIDKLNTYCAAGYLMQQSGADKMARDINRRQNYNFLADINHPDLMNWVYNSGLSLDELALIQPAYEGDWPCIVTELHYNNAGADVNEYLEVHQHSLASWAFQTALFYDHLGVLYKTLPRTGMQSFFESGNTYYYYLFPANESLADSGRIEFITNTSQVTSEFLYNSSGVTSIDHTPLFGQTKQFSVVEDGDTPVGNSLTFCGRYRLPDGSSTWNASVIPATIGIINPCVLVPVGISDFSYSVNSKTVELKWNTASGPNTDHFIVERSSDGNNFIAIGNVKALPAVNNAVTQYSFIDNAPGYINQYRLKQVDLNGTITYSPILYVKFTNASPVRVIANPVAQILMLEVNAVTTNTGNILIYDFHGKKMFEQNAKPGRQDISVSAFPPGKYMIQFQAADGKVYNHAFIKK